MVGPFIPPWDRETLLLARVGASRSAGERVCSGVDSQDIDLLKAGILTSQFSPPYHRDHTAYLIGCCQMRSV